MMLAQSTDLASVPESTLKWVLIILVAIALIGAALYAAFRRDNTVRIDDNPAPQFQKADKRYNHEATEQRFGRVESRLRDHDQRFDRMEEGQRKRNDRLMYALGRIAQKLNVNIDPTE